MHSQIQLQKSMMYNNDTINQKGGGIMDSRIALAANTQLHFQNNEGGAVRYTIIKEIGRGGSCIVYDASYETNAGDVKFVRIKECYPFKLRIERMSDGNLHADPADADRFKEIQNKFRSDFLLGNGLFYTKELYDALTNTIDIYAGNGTTYLASAFSPENTLASYQPDTLHVCVNLVKQVAQILDHIHKKGYLYLDTKPDNVLVLDTYTTRVQLFDFDSLIPMNVHGQYAPADPRSVRVSFTKGFAAIELQMGKVKKLGQHTDVYGVGALLFYLLFGTTPTAMDCEPDAVYDFATSKYAKEEYPDKLFFVLTEFFHNALANFYLDRYPDMEQVIEVLTKIEMLSDPTKPYIVSSKIIAPAFTVGRQQEAKVLSEWFNDASLPCVFVTGMGGIGKSTLVRTFLSQYRTAFDNLLYLSFNGTLERTLTDDYTAQIHTIEKFETESLDEYFRRKLSAITKIIKDSKSILVIDNYSGEINKALADIITAGWKVILVSRIKPAGTLYPVIAVDALTDRADLYRLFENNLGRKLQPNDCEYLDNIIGRVKGHTLVLELIAKQIASSYLTLKEASELVDTHGFAAMAPEKVFYSKDDDVYRETLKNIITALFEADQLSAQMKDLLKVMSLMSDAGIDIRLLHEILRIESKDDANTLIHDGWMNLCDGIIFLHPVIQETVHCWEWSAEAKAYAVKLMEHLFRELKVEEHREDYSKKLLWTMEVSREQFQKHPWMEKCFDRLMESQGVFGEAIRKRYERCNDWSPADHKKIAFCVQLSEGILDRCKREPLLLEENIYWDLLTRTVINMPRYREDFIMERAEELLRNPRTQNSFAIMDIYDHILSVYQERKNFDAASAKLQEAESVAKQFRHHYAMALYYDLLSDFYDHVLGGAYDAVEQDEEVLLKKMTEAIDKTIHHARKAHYPGGKQLLAKTILAKATLLIRSEPECKKQIDKLLSEAENIIFSETLPYAKVRCIYYMVKAWYAALVVPSFGDAFSYIHKAKEISDRIDPTDLDKIDNILIPSADMMCVLEMYALSTIFLTEGIETCEKNDTVVPYVRKKMELYRYLLDVYFEWKEYKECKEILAKIDEGNRMYRSIGVHVEIPEELRDLLSSGEEIQ